MASMKPGRLSWIFLSVVSALSLYTFIRVRNAHKMVSLATRLAEKGWVLFVSMRSCPYCVLQKRFFGNEAFAQLNVVDCDAENDEITDDDVAGEKKESLCRDHPVARRGTPSWYNVNTHSTMMGFQNNTARLERAALTGMGQPN